MYIGNIFDSFIERDITQNPRDPIFFVTNDLKTLYTRRDGNHIRIIKIPRAIEYDRARDNNNILNTLKDLSRGSDGEWVHFRGKLYIRNSNLIVDNNYNVVAEFGYERLRNRRCVIISSRLSTSDNLAKYILKKALECSYCTMIRETTILIIPEPAECTSNESAWGRIRNAQTSFKRLFYNEYNQFVGKIARDNAYIREFRSDE